MIKNRTLEDFKQSGDASAQQVSETIAKIRHQHYEEKRRAKMELLERTLRNGLLANLVTYSSLNQKSLMKPLSGTRTNYNSPGRQSASINLGALPSRTLPLSPQVEPSLADIPLKEPLDIEFKLNKKLAKQIYLKELEDKVKQHKDQHYEERELSIQRKMKREQELEKKRLEKIKNEMEDLEVLKAKRNEKLHHAVVNREHNWKTREIDLKK